MLGFSFVHPGILGGLALASLPVIIHLLNRRRFKTLEWAAMDFLLKAAVRNRRRVRLENLLLLLLRTLLVLLLIVAVARPFTERESALAGVFGVEGATERVILLDDSHSMRAGQGNQPAFDTGRRLVKRLLERLHDERSADRVTVLLGSRPRDADQNVTRIAAASAQGGELAKRLDAIRPGDGVLDVPTAIASVLDRFEDEGQRLVLHVVSDFRRRDWTDREGQLLPEVLEAFRAFRERGEIRLLDVGASPAQNAGLVELLPRDRAVVAGVPATFVATVKNHGPEPLANVQVTFRFGEQVQVPQKLDGALQPGESAQVRKEFTFRDGGPHVVTASLLTDVLPGDDVRRVVVDVRERMRFLLVDGETSSEHYRGETDFLAAALMPPGDVQSGIEVVPVPEHAFTGRELEDYDGVFLCNVYRLSADKVKRVEDFVAGGGGLVFFLGDQVDPQVYNATFYGKGDAAGTGLLPLYLLETEGASDDYVHLAPPAAEHEVTGFLRGMNAIVYRTVAVKRWVGARAPAAQEARVVLSFTDEAGSPALAEKSYGEGRVLLWTTAADNEWSNFPNSVLYLALAQEAARYVVRPSIGDKTLLAGAPIVLPFDPTRMQRLASVLPPKDLGESKKDLALRDHGEDEPMVFRYDRTHAAGAYTLFLRTPAGEEYRLYYAANVDPTEGDLRRAELDRVAADLPGVRVEQAGDEAALDTGDSDRTEFWRTLILLLIVCAALESLLAWRFGHHKRRGLDAEGKQVFVR